MVKSNLRTNFQPAQFRPWDEPDDVSIVVVDDKEKSLIKEDMSIAIFTTGLEEAAELMAKVALGGQIEWSWIIGEFGFLEDTFEDFGRLLVPGSRYLMRNLK
ncbi:hypothetical protein A4A49_28079 [Nicotiana attenuata]|uniref:Uncharacterized protein n=1 Tax=Nicotiana attenuata TaxID=49451 RepID=A0A1J6IUG4_NICAT|nr:hypothetical protein A4A49_28079 [Nicotiana attenuata]